MKILIYAEHREGALRKITYENITLAKELGQPFEVAVIGGKEDFKIELEKYGAEKVVFYNNDKLSQYSADGYAKILADAVKKQAADVLLMGATSTGKDLGPRVSALLNASMATDCTKVEIEGDNLKLVRPMYATSKG